MKFWLTVFGNIVTPAVPKNFALTINPLRRPLSILFWSIFTPKEGLMGFSVWRKLFGVTRVTILPKKTLQNSNNWSSYKEKNRKNRFFFWTFLPQRGLIVVAKLFVVARALILPKAVTQNFNDCSSYRGKYWKNWFVPILKYISPQKRGVKCLGKVFEHSKTKILLKTVSQNFNQVSSSTIFINWIFEKQLFRLNQNYHLPNKYYLNWYQN